MSESEELILAFLNSHTPKEELSFVNKIIIQVAKSDGGFISVLQSLGPWFTGDKPEQEVVKALKIIGELLAKVKTLKLSFKQKQVLAGFFLNRLKKLSFVDPASKCFEILLNDHLLTGDEESSRFGYTKLIELLEGEYWLTSAYIQPIRQRIYNSILAVLKSRPDLAKSMELKLLKIALEHTGEEKDPRNLFVVLAIWQKVLGIFDKESISKFKDNIFDSLSVYFPIIFKNKSSTSSITVEDLNIALNSCLSHELLLDQFVPLIFQKLAEQEADVRNGSISGLVYILENEFGGKSIYQTQIIQTIIDKCKALLPELKEKNDLKPIYCLTVGLLSRKSGKTGNQELTSFQAF